MDRRQKRQERATRAGDIEVTRVTVQGGGSAGATGPTGPTGADGASIIGPPGFDGMDGLDSWTIPGAPGAPGAAGPTIPGFDGEDGLDALPIPGPPGASVVGPMGPPGLDGVDPAESLPSWPPGGLTPYSIVDYVFTPDAAPAAVIVAGDQQGNIYHSGPNPETAFRLLVDAETAPGASGLPVTIEYGDTNDLDTVASWTTIATYTLSSEKSNLQDSMTNASIPANRLIRGNWGTIVGTPKDATATLRVKRPLSA